MFETAELGHKLNKEEFRMLEPELRTQLVDVQHRLKSANFSVFIIVGGVSGAGKSETVNLLHDWMDPRFLHTTAFAEPTDEEMSRPQYWRYWRKLPPKGSVGIFFDAWYAQPILDRVFKRSRKTGLARALQRIVNTEKELADSGTVIIKFWFHLSKKAQKERLTKLYKDLKTRWRVTDADWKYLKMYNRFRKISAEVIQTTSTAEAPWTIVDSVDPQYRSITVAQHILEKIKGRLGAEAQAGMPRRQPMPAPGKLPYTILDRLDVSLKFNGDYDTEIKKWQGQLNTISRKAKKKGVASVLVFEGWDAAGKGGAIRRIASSLDARDYRIIPVAAPTDEEKAQHYLWRFWRNMPPKGKIAIFDRSWYGRVLVERVEGFATEPEWQRAYAEINNFEEQLYGDGIVFIKYWLHIDQEEQLRRFEERKQIPYKQFKITEEDYRNREKYPQYELAVNEMIERTSTEFAPWTLVEANDKYYARIKVLKTFCDSLKAML